MKNTMTRNMKTKVIAAAMALMAMTSTTTVVMNSAINTSGITASAAPSITSQMQVNLDEDLMTAQKITSATILKVLEECTKYGKFFSPAISVVLETFLGSDSDPTMEKLEEISDKVDKLFDKIDESEKTVINAMETALGSNNAYQSFVAFRNKTKKMADVIKETMNDDEMSNADKLAKIGSLAGNYYEWDIKFEEAFDNADSYFKKCGSYSKSVFETIYTHHCQTSMFSGEAIDKSKAAFNTIMQTYSAGCTTILEVLGAQLYVTQLSDETKAVIDKEYMSHICQKSKDIMNKIDKVTTALLGNQTENGFEGKGTIAKMMEEILNRPRNIIVNEGHGDPCDYLKTTLFGKDFKSIPSVNEEKWNEKKRAGQQADWFNENVTNGQINGDVVRSIAKYAAKHGKTVRTLLNENGFDTSNLPKNCYIISCGAWGDSTFYMFAEHGWAYFKGINIDDASGSEQQVKFWNVGWNGQDTPFGFIGEKWNFAETGSACRFQCK